MNIAIRAAIAILCIASIGTAYADSEGGQNANTQFTQTRVSSPRRRCRTPRPS